MLLWEQTKQLLKENGTFNMYAVIVLREAEGGWAKYLLTCFRTPSKH